MAQTDTEKRNCKQRSDITKEDCQPIILYQLAAAGSGL